MPRELVAIAIRTPVIREYQDEPLRTGEIRVRTTHGAVKHGTELHLYRGDHLDMHYDTLQQVFVPGEGGRARFPMPLGNMAVGVVIKVAEGVEEVACAQ